MVVVKVEEEQLQPGQHDVVLQFRTRRRGSQAEGEPGCDPLGTKGEYVVAFGSKSISRPGMPYHLEDHVSWRRIDRARATAWSPLMDCLLTRVL